MDSTLLLIYRTMVIGLIAGCLWGFVAYGRAFWATRRLMYLLSSFSWLIWPGAFAVIYLLQAQPHLGKQPHLIDTMSTFAPLMPFISLVLVLAFSQRPSAELFEFHSMRDIMLFRPTIPPAPQQDGLFVPQTRPPRPSLAAFVAVTIGMFGAIWALLALIGRLIVWLV